MEEELQKLGLSEYEARVYLATLGMGPSSAFHISEKTNIKRPTVYLALENLIKQGLVFENFINKKRLFQAEKPEKLSKLTKRMRRKVIDAEISLESILPEILKIPREYAEDPQVTVYHGLEGIKNILLEVSRSSSSWYFFGSSTRVFNSLSQADIAEIFEEGSKFRKDPKRPKIFFITDAGILASELKETITPWREMKILPKTINAGSAFIIYEDKLVILNFVSKPFATIIRSKEVMEVLKIMYQLIWKSLPEEKASKGQ